MILIYIYIQFWNIFNSDINIYFVVPTNWRPTGGAYRLPINLLKIQLYVILKKNNFWSNRWQWTQIQHRRSEGLSPPPTQNPRSPGQSVNVITFSFVSQVFKLVSVWTLWKPCEMLWLTPSSNLPAHSNHLDRISP